MTARLDQLPLQAVLDKLQQLTGMRYVLPPAVAERTISARVQALPLVKALREIFASLSYSIRTDAGGHVLSVVILEMHDGVSQTAGSPRASYTAESMLITPAQGEEMSVIFPPTAEPMTIVPSSEERMPMTLPLPPYLCRSNQPGRVWECLSPGRLVCPRHACSCDADPGRSGMGPDARRGVGNILSDTGVRPG